VIQKIAMLGNHTPRQCGIATFTTDLCEALAGEHSGAECLVVAMNDPGRRHAYPARVRFEIAESDLASYRRAADFLNVNDVDVVSVQHEYGIFGGKAGGHVLELISQLRMPVVTTLHTILAEPNPQQKRVMDDLTAMSERLVVMSANGAALLRDVHGVGGDKIDLIPHGIPSIPTARASKDKLGVEGRSVILTFGLLSPDKGIEYVIDALPAILARHPNAVYIVLGATHPHVKARYGETYRFMLEDRAATLGVDASVVFHNRFVSHEELIEFLSAADIYTTPYLKAEQITSGTLAYAVGAGKAVVSTPYRYACELLAEGRGVLVPWRDSAAIAREVTALLGDDDKRRAIQERAAEFGRGMTWPVVARSYLRSFARAHDERASRLRATFQATRPKRPIELPEMNLSHLRLMTDDTGLLQHAAFSIPRYDDGYCLDDNARALLLTALVEDAGTDDAPTLSALATRYLAFVFHAFNRGRFRNFMSYSRQWVEEAGSDDSHGRALWALGAVIGRSSDPGRRSLAGDLFHAALPAMDEIGSPRAWAYALLGIDHYLRAFRGDSNVQAVGLKLAEQLLALHREWSTDDWPWFEDRLTYCNPRLSQALLVAGEWTGRREMTETGLSSLEWIASVQRSNEGYFAPVGSAGFYMRGGQRAWFDQQSVEAYVMVSACLEAQRVTGESRWADRARRSFSWYFGHNDLEQPVYDPATGGCRDGLHPDRVNENQGAEATLSFLLALVELRSTDRTASTSRTASPRGASSAETKEAAV
jgi:glycosyltransferase involved in cell wall biosynthesis